VIVVVEDDERVRALTMETLKEIGYSVIEAANPSQALRMIEDAQQITCCSPTPSCRHVRKTARRPRAKAPAAAQGALHHGLHAQHHRPQRQARPGTHP